MLDLCWVNWIYVAEVATIIYKKVKRQTKQWRICKIPGGGAAAFIATISR